MKAAIHFLVFAVSILLSTLSLAAAVVEAITGDVRSGLSVNAANTVSTGQRIDTGTTVFTGAKSLVTLRFDDGQVVVLHNDTEFRVRNYAFAVQDATKDSFVFDLLRGAMRSVTALVTKRNPQAYALNVPTSTIGIRGTDFLVGVANNTYMSVLNGTISVTNAAGVATVDAGATAMVTSTASLATPIAASSLPTPVASAFSELGALPISPTESAGPGAQSASGAASGGISVGAIGVIGAAVAAAVASSSSNSQQTPSAIAAGTTATTSTTGTR